MRLVLALTAAGGRRAVPLLQPRLWCPLSSKAGKPPSNPFEIDLSPLKTPVPTTEKLSLVDAKWTLASQQADAPNDIDLLHDEMSELFGEQMAQYRGGESSSGVEEDAAASENKTQTKERGTALYKEDGTNAGDAVDPESEPSSMLATKAGRADATFKKKQIFSGEKRTGKGNSSGTAPVNVILLQGPCSFVRGVWTGGDVGRKELWQRIQALADDLKVGVKSQNYDSEKMVLEKILEAREDQVIVLCWNISLSKSPFIVHALELIRSNAIIVSPSNVEHGPLPANVVGVLSGFRDQSLSLALNAAANLCGPGVSKKQKPSETSDTKCMRGFRRSASVKNNHASGAKAKKNV